MFSLFKSKVKPAQKPKSCCSETEKIRKNNSQVKDTLKELTAKSLEEQEKTKSWIKKTPKEV